MTTPTLQATRHPRVKICGHTRMQDVRTSVRAGVDAVGVIANVPVDTPREVSVERARELLATVPPLVTGVLVTMPETVDRAVELVERTAPDAVQIHDGLDPDEIDALAAAVDVDVIAAVDASNSGEIAEYAAVADALLVDSTSEDGGGGTGRTQDWERTSEAIAGLEIPVILAGGLTPENVGEAIATVEPFGVDTASGVERSRSDCEARQEVERAGGVERSRSDRDARQGAGRTDEPRPGAGIKDADAVAAFVRVATEREVVA